MCGGSFDTFLPAGDRDTIYPQDAKLPEILPEPEAKLFGKSGIGRPIAVPPSELLIPRSQQQEVRFRLHRCSKVVWHDEMCIITCNVKKLRTIEDPEGRVIRIKRRGPIEEMGGKINMRTQMVWKPPLVRISRPAVGDPRDRLNREPLSPTVRRRLPGKRMGKI